MTNTILQIVKIDPELIEEIKAAWHRLPETDHADGKYRLRKYSYVECNIDGTVYASWGWYWNDSWGHHPTWNPIY